LVAEALSGLGTLAALSFVLAGPLPAGDVQAQSIPPNIIYIITDDQGWKAIGCRAPDIKTPNIDELAAEGLRLEQYHAQPMCKPTRAALMTGCYPFRHGMQTAVIPQAGTYGLASDDYLLPEMLRDAGSVTAMTGKWHLGHAKTALWPRQRGFESICGALLGEVSHFTHRAVNGNADWHGNNEPLQEEGYDNILFADEAVRVIDAHDPSKPLFLFLARTAPHTPLKAPQEYVDRNSQIADESGRNDAAMISVIKRQWWCGQCVACRRKRGQGQALSRQRPIPGDQDQAGCC